MVNKISTVVEFTTDKAQTAVQKFRTEVGNAEGTVNKLKAGASSAFATLGANIGLFAVGAAGAIATFGAKAIGTFTDTAKAAVDLSSATGLSIEDASRWIAVGDDFQVGAEALQTGLGRIAKTLDDTKWEKYGIDTRDASGKARDANEILLDTFDKLAGISNETERARVGTELFGKGYANIAPLVGKTREEYEKYLAAVEDGQVVTEQEAAKAEKTRLALDNLRDSAKELSLAAGELLAPAVADVADELSDVTNQVLSLKSALEKIPGMPKAVQLWWDYMSPKAQLVTNMTKVYEKVIDLGKGLVGLGGHAETAKEKNQRLSDSFVSVTSTAGLARGAAAAHADELEHAEGRIVQYHNAVDLATVSLEWEAAAEDRAREATERHREAIDATREAEDRRIAAALKAVGGDIGIRAANQDAIAAFNDPNMSFDQKIQAILNDAIQIAAIRQTQLEAGGNKVDAKVQAQLLKDALAGFAGLFGGIVVGPGSELGNAIAQVLNGYINEVTNSQAAIAGGGNGTGSVRNGIRTYDTGGVVPGPIGAPQLAVVHGGEEVLTPAQRGGSGASNVSVEIDGRTLFRIMWDETERQTRSGWRPGPGVRRVMSA